MWSHLSVTRRAHCNERILELEGPLEVTSFSASGSSPPVLRHLPCQEFLVSEVAILIIGSFCLGGSPPSEMPTYGPTSALLSRTEQVRPSFTLYTRLNTHYSPKPFNPWGHGRAPRAHLGLVRAPSVGWVPGATALMRAAPGVHTATLQCDF